MRTYLVAFGISTVTALVLTPVVRHIAPRLGAIDLPSGRHINTQAIPRLGGIAILFGFLAPLMGLFIYDNKISVEFTEDMWRAMSLILGGVAIAILGIHDDIKGTRAVVKLGVQVLVAIGAYAGGFSIQLVNLPFVGQLEMGIFAAPVTVFWIVGIINAVNLIDGLDGLAAGVAFFVCVVSFVMGLLSHSVLVALFSAALGGALVGFLFYNFNPATIFMGDTGSLFVGYILATTSLLGSKGGTAVALLVPILAMGLPIMDTLLAISRRLFEKRSIFSPDTRHIHHRLLGMGLTHRRTVLILYGLSIMFTATAIVIYMGRSWQVGVALLIATILIFVMIRAVGVFEKRINRVSQIAGLYPDMTNSIRNALPGFIIAASKSLTIEDLLQAMAGFCDRAKLVFAQGECEHEHRLKDWVWESKVEKEGSSRGYVTTVFIIRDSEEGLPIKIKFGWHSDTSSVSPQTDVLLRMVVEELERYLWNDHRKDETHS